MVTPARRTPSNRASNSWVVGNSLLSRRSCHINSPAGEPFVEPPAPICKRRLVALHHESVDIVQQGGSETLAAPHDLAQQGGGDAERRSGGLHQELVGGTVLAQYDAVPGHAFVADHTDFDAMVGLCNADQGDQAAFDEIDMRDQITRPFKDLVHIETDESKMGPKQIKVGVRERRQKTIARTVW